MRCSIAPAKIILFGEHFVVKGKPGLGVAISRYAKVCVRGGSNRIYSTQLGVLEKGSKNRALFDEAIEHIEEFAGKNVCLDIYVDSPIPIASGLGSSAAVAVALVHATLGLLDVEFTKEDVRKIAHEAEKAVHYKPSGVDTTLATYGGLLYYRRGEFRLLDDLQLPTDLSLIVVNTGIKRSTGVIVRDVLGRYERIKRVARHIYEAGREIVRTALRAIKRGDKKLLGELMLVNQGLLWSMGASSRQCDELVYKLLDLGALGAKITGAGRGGVVIGLASKGMAKFIVNELIKSGFEAFIAEPEYNGVRHVNPDQTLLYS